MSQETKITVLRNEKTNEVVYFDIKGEGGQEAFDDYLTQGFCVVYDGDDPNEAQKYFKGKRIKL